MVFLPLQFNFLEDETDQILGRQNRMAIATAWSWSAQKWPMRLAGNLRGEVINQQAVLLPGLSIDGGKNIFYKINVQKTYRAPSLNELYYDPGGQINLRPEEGWNADAQVGIIKKWTNHFGLKADQSFYYRNIKDWIIWYGGAIWTPHNIARVRSVGGETHIDFEKSCNRWKAHLGGQLHYGQSIVVESIAPNSGGLGNQIPNTPQLSWRIYGQWDWKNLSVGLNCSYTGLRYSTIDESEWVPEYCLLNGTLDYKMHVQKCPIALGINVNNLTNRQYQIVNGRPMPGINAMIYLKISFSKNLFSEN